jgi:glutamyl-tRNA synthetase
MPHSAALDEIIQTVFGDDLPDPAALERQYPPRVLPEGAMVTRVGPSPTGFMHIGTLYVGLLSYQLARQSSGVSFLRIEDTDKKREVEGALGFIQEAFDHYGIRFDEGLDAQGGDVGSYGPYTQSRRMKIYQAYVRALMQRGLAYLCFASPEELDALRQKQQARSTRPGYYGKWAIWRDRSEEDALAALREGKPYVVRFRSMGDIERKVMIDDLIFGERALAENDQDIVIMKSDRLPTYHLAHVVDDHLMRTTHVVRADEWLPSLTTHLQMFDALGWAPPRYAHIAPINKLDGGSRRKLSKRKDPEASVSYFMELGYPIEAVLEYLLNLANSNFEDWRKQNPATPWREFTLTFERLRNSSGPLFDFAKLDSISKDVVSRLSASELYDRIETWARRYDASFATLIASDADYVRKILSIERGGEKVRKDIAKWADVRDEIRYFFDSEFGMTLEAALPHLGKLQADDVRAIVQAFKATYQADDENAPWFDKIKAIARAHGFAESGGEYKRNPDAYKGMVADVAKVFRVLLTGKPQTPDLHALMKVMGQERVFARLSIAE